MLKSGGMKKTLRLKNVFKVIALMLVVNVFSILLSTSNNVNAEEKENNIIILLDNSLSMQELGLSTLSKIAGNMVLDSVDHGVNVGVITFGTETTVLNKINENIDVEQLKEKLNNIAFDEKGTNMKDGIKRSIEELNTVEGEKTVIILSDGLEDIPGGLPANHIDEMNSLISDAEKSDIVVHAIALSENVEKQYLNRITNRTNGSFRDGKSASKLFEALTSIIGVENGFNTVANYNTATTKTEKIKLSNMIEDVIINVAACDNIQPQMAVKLNGEIVEPTSSGQLYEVYKFENEEYAELEITSLVESNTTVIVQLRSKAELNIKSNFKNYLSIPMNIPIEYELELLCDGDEIPVGTFVERKGAKLDYSHQRNIFVDSYEGTQPGEDTINYTVKDGNGGIIAMNTLTISINDYPPYYYDNLVNTIIKGDKFNVSITPKDSIEVKELGGMLIVKQGEEIREIPLISSGNKLTAEIDVNELSQIEYYVFLRGVKVTTNENFEYNLPTQILEVRDRPAILFATDSDKSKNISIGSKEKITLNVLKESVIPEDTDIKIFDIENNEIGAFLLKKGTVGDIEVEIEPELASENLTLLFSCNNNYDVTEKIETNIKVMSQFALIFEEYAKPIIIVIVIIAIIVAFVLGIYLYGIKVYKEDIENYSTDISITYDISPIRRSGASQNSISRDNPTLYINYYERENTISLDDEIDNVIGVLEYRNKYGDSMKWYQGIVFRITKGDMIKIYYVKQEEEEIYYANELIEDDIEYKNGVIVVYKVNKKQIEIQL